jgi:hypothetical protein
MQAVLRARLPVLECGSGLTTIVLGVLVKYMGNSLWSLEHMPEWTARVRANIARFSLVGTRVLDAPLRNYGGFDWYSMPAEQLPAQFGVVVCDGPPSATRGGRYGLGPVMKDRMGPECLILLDDAVRQAEQAVVLQWTRELGARAQYGGKEKSFFTLTIGGDAPVSKGIKQESDRPAIDQGHPRRAPYC